VLVAPTIARTPVAVNPAGSLVRCSRVVRGVVARLFVLLERVALALLGVSLFGS
jgi:hypothetical protein